MPLYSHLRHYLPLFLAFFTLLLTTSPACASVKHLLNDAVTHLEQHQYAEALELLHDAASRLPDSDRVDNLLTVAYLGQGFQLLRTGDFSAARESFIEGRNYAVDDLRLWQGEAIAWYRQGKYAEAVTVLDQAIGINPEHADIQLLLGKAYYADGRMPEALDALTRAREHVDSAQIDQLLNKIQREWQVEQEMGREVRGRFQLSFIDGEQAAGLATSIVEALEDVYAELGSDLAYYPDVTVPVLLYTKQDFTAVTASPDWAGAVYDGKIRLPLGNIHHMTPVFKSLLYHEYAHAVVHFLANRHAPVWLNEGLAEVAGRRIHPSALTALEAAVQSHNLLSWEGTLDKSFSALVPEQVPLAYQQSYSLVNFMVERYGWHKIRELLDGLGSGRDWRVVIKEVYQDYGLDWPAIRNEWQASL